MSLLLRLLSRFLVLPVVDPEPAADAPPPAPAAGDDLDGTLDDLIDASADEVPRETEDEPAPAPRVSAREQQLQRELDTEREIARRVAEQRQTPSAPQAQDPQFAEEERRIADAARTMDANSAGWVKWSVEVDRKNRKVQQDTHAALMEARDLADQASFRAIRAEKPGLFNRYADRVEKEIAGLRASGQRVPPREAVLAFLVGKDAVNGTLKKTTTTPKPNAPAAPAQTVDRGRMPQARTDVRGRANAASDREKRNARLRDVPI